MHDDQPRPPGRVLVLGASGMLGHTLLRTLSATLPDTAIVGTVRSLDQAPERLRTSFADQLLDGVDVLAYDSVEAAVRQSRPDVVINAVGVIKQAAGVDDAVVTTRINALLPHLLARTCSETGARLVQVSTDCVFSGRTGGYTEDDVPDPVDFYGRSKLLGEVGAPHVTLRTSIIGHELRYGASLLEWFLGQDGRQVRGFTRAIYSGLPTAELSRVVAEHVLPRPDLTGVWHVASTPISKFDLLGIIAAEYGWSGDLTPEDDFSCDRSLVAKRFGEATGYTPPPWTDLVRDMRAGHHDWSAA